MTTGIRDVKEVDPVTLKDLLGEAVRGRGMAAVLAPHAPPHTSPLASPHAESRAESHPATAGRAASFTSAYTVPVADSTPESAAFARHLRRAMTTAAPLLAADFVALALSGIFAEAVVHLVGQHASGIAGRAAPVVLLPLVLGYWLGGLYSEVWVHPALQLKQTTHVTSLGLLAAALAGCAAFFLTAVFFPSAWVVLQILNAIPTAFVGGVLALVLTGQTLTVASLVGFISLGGIAVRNGILLVTHYVHLMRHEGETFGEHMILRGSLERLAPVLMTALTAGIGLIPLVVAGQQPGREILYPVATVILGGLVTSTFCEFLIHPGLFWRFGGRTVGAVVEEGGDELGE